MWSSGQAFFSRTSLKSYTEGDVLSGKVVKINPALTTITDGLVNKVEIEILQKKVLENVIMLLKHGKVRTFHADIDFEDYSGFNIEKPAINYEIFDPHFLENLNQIVRSYNGFLDLHLLTDYPQDHLQDFKFIKFGAICFQLETIKSSAQLRRLVSEVIELGACPSPVIETVGSDNKKPMPIQEVETLLKPVLSDIGMLTFTAARTASRSNTLGGLFDSKSTMTYIEPLKQSFQGTIQIQGGITKDTISKAVNTGAEFLVTGTEIFRNRTGLTPEQAIDEMLQKAAESLQNKSNNLGRPR
jgi:pentose-5-phosphate-3-epimerase